MKPWCLLLICLSCNLMKASADYFHRFDREQFLPHLLLLGVVAILLLSLRTRRIVPVATSTPRTTIATARPQPRCNDGYTLYSGPGKKFCFRAFPGPRGWESAQSDCQMENAGLLVLDNDSLLPFGDVMRQQFPEGRTAWLLAKTDANLNANYIGGANIPSNSPMWTGGEPDTPNNCILMEFNANRARLLDQPCGVSQFFVCQHF